MTCVRILIADDHDLARQGVRHVVENQTGWVVCGEARTGREAVTKAVELQPDIVVLDFSMPELNGLEATRQIRRAVSSRILVLTMHESDQVVTELIDAGAHGCVLKSDAGRTLVEAIHALLEDREFFTERVQQILAAQPARPRRRRDEVKGGLGPLTPREREVVQLLAEGKSNTEVGVVLGITMKTAETHREHIFEKLQLHSMSELVHYAIQNRIIEP
jgi:DNA-binding NarL/FixJ family response regulator